MKDNLKKELKNIFDEETENIQISSMLKNRILENRPKSIKEKIGNFLEKEIEIPLVPMIVGFAMMWTLVALPKDFYIFREEVRIVNIGSSQIVVREERGWRDEN